MTNCGAEGFDLGIDPLPLTVRVYRDATFTSEIRPKGTTWEPGTGIELRFPATGNVWTATVTPDSARFEIPAAVVALEETGAVVELWRTLGPVEEALGVGSLVREGD